MRRNLLILIALCASLMIQASQVYDIYPVPHEQEPAAGTASFARAVTVVAEAGIDEVTVSRARQVLTEHGMQVTVARQAPRSGAVVLLGVNGSRGVADKRLTALGVSRAVFGLPKFDRHILSLTSVKGAPCVTIVGENTDAVFCGLASLEQMLDCGTRDLPCVTITDYADIRNRGVIEGYYGVPYTAAVTKDLFRFMARYKLNCYMYGAKSDPYHSRYWDRPYPTAITPEQEEIGYLTQDMMRDINRVARDCKVNFIWAIHPGKAFANPDDPAVLTRIMDKFASMHELGVRQFGVFVDDVGVPQERSVMDLCARNISRLQELIDTRWNAPGAAAADTVKPLHYVPQLYAFSWVSRDKAREFFQSLRATPAKLNIYITGRNVWSVPNNEDLRIVHDFLGRDVSWWWNYPCNDEDYTKLFVMDTYTNFRDETHILSLSRLEPELRGTNALIINPMQQGELSKIALFSVADYTWNTAAFNNDLSYRAAVKAVPGGRFSEPFHRVAPYLRYYDSDALDYLVARYKVSIDRKRPSHETLLTELREVNEACGELKAMAQSHSESDRLFYHDMEPWLLKLEAMTAEAIALFEGKNPPAGDYTTDPRYQFKTLGGMGEHISLRVRTAEPAACALPQLLQWLHEQDTIK